MMGAARWMSCCVVPVPAAAGTTALYENGNICTVQYDCMVQYQQVPYHTTILRPGDTVVGLLLRASRQQQLKGEILERLI
jgi:hypothetical protein